jgi:tricorn protease-like protein
MCPTPKFNKKIGKLIPIEAKDYIMVDDSLRTAEHKQLPSEMAMDYSWHPKSNTLFYVKGELDRNIWYYNVESRERRMLETNTTWNYSISFSPDGKYILFSTLELEPSNNHFTNCSSKNSLDNSQCCDDGLSRIICVAELIRNE